MREDPYKTTTRIDWARRRLKEGRPLNSTYLVGQFGVSSRTALRDIRYIRDYYGPRLKYDYRERSFYLDFTYSKADPDC